MRTIALARHLARLGFSVIPLCRDGKTPAVPWKEYQDRIATDDELVEWFHDTQNTPGIVTGKLSGITVIDCDTRETAESWPDRSPMSQTTTRGRHFVYRHNGERNTVRVAGVDGVDRRGQGGYVRAYPECCHWTREGIDSLPTLADEYRKQASGDCPESSHPNVRGWRSPVATIPRGIVVEIDLETLTAGVRLA